MADTFNQLDENNKRLVVRGNIKQWNQLLAEAAHNAGVITDEEFAIFQNAGYMGLYGGLTVADIHRKNPRLHVKHGVNRQPVPNITNQSNDRHGNNFAGEPQHPIKAFRLLNVKK